MILVEGSELDTINLTFFVLCFEEMSGLRINFDKGLGDCFWLFPKGSAEDSQQSKLYVVLLPLLPT
jgi:hypothetical protein